MRTRKQLIIAMERAGSAMAHELRGIDSTGDLVMAWDTAFGDMQQINHLTGTPSYEALEADRAQLAERMAVLEAENHSVREALSDKVIAETMITDMSIRDGGMNITYEGGACQLLAETLGQQFRDKGGPNYFEIGFNCKDGLKLLVTIQKTDGQTPGALRAQAETKLAAALEEIAALKATPHPHADEPITHLKKLQIVAGCAVDDLERLHAEFGFPDDQAIDVDDMIEAIQELQSAATQHADEAARVEQTAAACDVLAERERQKSVEGWTPGHDDEHDSGQLAVAAACYAVENSQRLAVKPPPSWPWDASWWKPKGSRRNLVKAGALILAEIERLDRATSPSPAEGKS